MLGGTDSLNFCLMEKLDISPSILNVFLAGYYKLGCRYFLFQYFKSILPFPSGLAVFLMKDQLLSTWGNGWPGTQ